MLVTSYLHALKELEVFIVCLGLLKSGKISGVPMKTPNSTEEFEKKHDNSGGQVREDSEYVRLVISNETGLAETDSESQWQSRKRSLIRWIKALLWFIITVIAVLIFIKWGVPFLAEKVLFPLLQWEATAFGRPVLALVLIGSLALFPVVLIPSGPSMWLAGMIFGYGLGFVIIMVGTTIGMVLPYLIGLTFRDRIHQWLKKWPQKAAMLSGRLIRTLADVKYRNHQLTPVEIIYNTISFIVAIITTIAFTIYARRTLNELEVAEANGEGPPIHRSSSFELRKLPLEKFKAGFTMP
ncbi:UNVERIFIED_CONTAM: hypothetical protein Sradi_1485200 [Sesamum radiatum]|uniref:SNARE associated Golgi protein family n=1 Tax=Sesamum radiatum TaxID=300843 RepID=A0AAW2U7C6_SESRA